MSNEQDKTRQYIAEYQAEIDADIQAIGQAMDFMRAAYERIGKATEGLAQLIANAAEDDDE